MIEMEVSRETKQYMPKHIAAMLLRKIKEQAKANLEEVFYCVEKLLQSLQGMVLTMPANFNNAQRSELVEAGYLADLQTVRLVNEPAAAVAAYRLDVKEGQLQSISKCWTRE